MRRPFELSTDPLVWAEGYLTAFAGLASRLSAGVPRFRVRAGDRAIVLKATPVGELIHHVYVFVGATGDGVSVVARPHFVVYALAVASSLARLGLYPSLVAREGSRVVVEMTRDREKARASVADALVGRPVISPLDFYDERVGFTGYLCETPAGLVAFSSHPDAFECTDYITGHAEDEEDEATTLEKTVEIAGKTLGVAPRTGSER